MDVGGRYHTIQVDFNGCSDGALGDWIVRDEVEVFEATPWVPPSFTASFPRFSLTEVADPVAEPKSRDVPGVFGVFAEDPKDAKAPEPRPKADEAPELGEETLVDNGEIALKGLDRPWEGVSPNRLADVKARGESVLLLPLKSV